MKSKINYLSLWELKELKNLYKKEEDKKVKLRLLCAIHRKNGDTIIEISEKLFLAKSTVHDYLKRFEQGSKKSLKDKSRPGKPSKLSKMQTNELKKVIQDSPKRSHFDVDYWSTSLVRIFLKEKFGEKYTLFGTRKLLKRLGFSLQKPRPMHYKGDVKEHGKFKKKFKEPSKFSRKMATKSYIWMKVHS